MIVEADDALHRTGQHFVGGLDAGGFAQQFNIEPLVGEIAQLLSEHRRQIDLLFNAADHQRNVSRARRRKGRQAERQGQQQRFQRSHASPRNRAPRRGRAAWAGPVIFLRVCNDHKGRREALPYLASPSVLSATFT